MKKWLALFALIGAILACGTSTPSPSSEQPEPTESSQDEEAQEEAPEEEEDAPEPTQESVEPTEAPTTVPEPEASIGLQILEIADSVTPGTFYEAEEGTRLVGARVALWNGTGDSISTNALNFELADSDGLLYESELAASDELNQILLVELRPDERAQGWVFFTVPEDAAPLDRVKYTTNLFGGESVSADIAAAGPPDWPAFEAPSDLPPLGEASVVNGISLTVQSVVDPAGAGIFYEPVEGFRLVAVEALLRNESAPEAVSTNALNFFLIDDQGFVYDAQLSASDREDIQLADAAQGEAAQGFITFLMQEGNQPLYLRYSASFLSNEVGPTAGAQ